MSNDKKSEGLRYDAGKMRFSLIPHEALVELSRVYTKGSLKYDDHNWRKGMKWSKCDDALQRHYEKWKAGHIFDPETMCQHLAQVAWNALTLMIYEMQGLGTDDVRRAEQFTYDDNFDYMSVEDLPPMDFMQQFYAAMQEHQKIMAAKTKPALTDNAPGLNLNRQIYDERGNPIPDAVPAFPDGSIHLTEYEQQSTKIARENCGK